MQSYQAHDFHQMCNPKHFQLIPRSKTHVLVESLGLDVVYGVIGVQRGEEVWSAGNRNCSLTRTFALMVGRSLYLNPRSLPTIQSHLVVHEIIHYLAGDNYNHVGAGIRAKAAIEIATEVAAVAWMDTHNEVTNAARNDCNKHSAHYIESWLPFQGGKISPHIEIDSQHRLDLLNVALRGITKEVA